MATTHTPVMAPVRAKVRANNYSPIHSPLLLLISALLLSTSVHAAMVYTNTPWYGRGSSQTLFEVFGNMNTNFHIIESNQNNTVQKSGDTMHGALYLLTNSAYEIALYTNMGGINLTGGEIEMIYDDKQATGYYARTEQTQSGKPVYRMYNADEEYEYRLWWWSEGGMWIITPDAELIVASRKWHAGNISVGYTFTPEEGVTGSGIVDVFDEGPHSVTSKYALVSEAAALDTVATNDAVTDAAARDGEIALGLTNYVDEGLVGTADFARVSNVDAGLAGTADFARVSSVAAGLAGTADFARVSNVDAGLAGTNDYLRKSGDTMTGTLIVPSVNSLTCNFDIVTISNLTVLNMTATNLALFTTNVTVQGVLNMSGYAITNMGEPTLPKSATTKQYVDGATNAALMKSGGVLTGKIDFGQQQLTNVGSFCTPCGVLTIRVGAVEYYLP